MNSLLLISPYKGSGFQPIFSGNCEKKFDGFYPAPDRQIGENMSLD